MTKDKITFNKLLYILLLVFLAFVPKINLISFSMTTAGVRIDDFIVLILFLMFLMSIFTKRSIKIESEKFKKTRKFIIIYLAVCLISVIVGSIAKTINPFSGIIYFCRKIEYFLFIYFGYDFYKSEEDKDFLTKFILVSIIFHFVVAILQYFGFIGAFISGSFEANISRSRIASIFNGPYEFAGYLLLLIPFISCNIKNNAIKIVSFIIIFVCIYLSQSRTSLIVFFVILLLQYIAKNNSKNFKKIFIYAFLSITSIFIITNIGDIIEYLPRFETLNLNKMILETKRAWMYKDFNSLYGHLSQEGDMSFNIRISKNMSFIDGVIKHPIFGMGLSVVKIAADCNYIRIAAESGILGLVAFLALISCIYIEFKRGKLSLEQTIKFQLITLILSAIFIDIFEASKVITFFYFILGASFKQEKLEGSKDDEN